MKRIFLILVGMVSLGWADTRGPIARPQAPAKTITGSPAVGPKPATHYVTVRQNGQYFEAFVSGAWIRVGQKSIATRDGYVTTKSNGSVFIRKGDFYLQTEKGLLFAKPLGCTSGCCSGRCGHALPGSTGTQLRTHGSRPRQ